MRRWRFRRFAAPPLCASRPNLESHRRSARLLCHRRATVYFFGITEYRGVDMIADIFAAPPLDNRVHSAGDETPDPTP